MSKIVYKVFCDTYFKIIMISLFMVMMVPYLQNNYGGIVKFGLLFGVFITILYLLKNKLFFKKDATCIALCLFVLLYFVTIVLNRGYYFVSNIKELVYMAVFFFVFFIALQNKERSHVDFNIISFLLVFESFVVSTASLITFLFGINKTYQLVENGTNGEIVTTDYYIGLAAGRLYGVTNANALASLCLISIILSVYLFFTFKDKKSVSLKTFGMFFLSINLIIQYFCLLLTQTRSALFAGLIILFFALIVFLNKKIEIKSYIAKCVVSVVVSCVLVLSFYELSQTILRVSSYLPTAISVSIQEKETPITALNFNNNNVALLSIDFEEPVKERTVLDTDFFTGRIDLWKSGLEIFANSPILGLSREGFIMPVYEKTYALTGQYNTAVITGGLHNIYLTVLVSSGVVGFIIISFVVLSVLYKFFCVLITKHNVNKETMTAFFVSLSFFIVEFVESRILYQVNVFNVIFWIYFGYLYYFANKEYKEIKSKEDLMKE